RLTHSVRARDRLPRASLTTLLVAPRDGRQDEREERDGPQSFENRLDFRLEDSHVSPALPVPQDGCHLTTSTMRNTASRERIPLRSVAMRTATEPSPLSRQGEGQPDRLTARSAPRDRFGELHVAHAIVERRAGDPFFAADGVDELLLDAPSASSLGRDGDLAQRCVAPPAAPELESVGLHTQRAFGAEQPDLGGGCQRRHRAESQVADPTAFELDQDVDVIRYRHLSRHAASVTPLRDGHRRHRGHARGGTDPAHHRLVPDAHIQDIEATEALVLPPVQRSLALDELALRRPFLHGEHVTEIAVA